MKQSLGMSPTSIIIVLLSWIHCCQPTHLNLALYLFSVVHLFLCWIHLFSLLFSLSQNIFLSHPRQLSLSLRNGFRNESDDTNFLFCSNYFRSTLGFIYTGVFRWNEGWIFICFLICWWLRFWVIFPNRWIYVLVQICRIVRVERFALISRR